MPFCRYCDLSNDDAWAFTDHALAAPPGNALAAGHVVVAPRRHVGQFYELDVQEQRAVWGLVEAVRKQVRDTLRIDRFCIGFADCEPGDEGHAVVHVVPNPAGRCSDLPAEIEWVAQD